MRALRVPRPSARRLRTWLTGIALAGLSTVGSQAGPPKPGPTPVEAPAKSPVELQNDRLDAGLSTFDDDLQAASDFTVTFQRNQPGQPEQPALDAGRAEAAKFQLSVAAAAAADVRSLRTEAARYETAMPAYARSLRQQAEQKLETARGFLDRANAIRDPTIATPGPPAAGRGPVVGDGCDEACRLLLQMAATSRTRGGSEVFEFDRQRAIPILPTLPGPARDPIFKGRMQAPTTLAPDAQTLILPGGQRFDPKDLRDAVADVDPQAAAQPLFEDCGDQACPSRGFIRMLGDADKRAELRRVGGVSLDFSFDLLATSGMSELRGGMDLEAIENPVLVSLTALADAAEPFKGDWDNLPEAVRFPGSIGRIRGFVLSGDGQDVFVIGSRAATAAERLDIDTLSVALRTIWREGLVPAVSLDPRLDQIGGPQYPRVVELPTDSAMTAIMLDADYAMKTINLGAGWAGPLNLTGRDQIVRRLAASADASLSRFWLTPRPLGRQSLYRSGSGRTVLFETAVQVQTETMFVQNGQLIGTATKGGMEQELAQAFTEAYPMLERAAAVRPAAIFSRLHGVVDAAMFAGALRELALRPAALERIASLPYRHLVGAAAVPESYPGLGSTMAFDNFDFEVWGGAELRLRAPLASVQPTRDHVGSDLERKVDGWGGGIAETADLTLAAPQVAVPPADPADDALLAASRALGREDWAAAQSAFAEIAAQHPDRSEAHHGLALALMGSGHLTEAIVPLARALVLVPGDAASVALLQDLSWQIDPVGTKSILTPSEQAGLSRHYSWLALRDQGDGKSERAERRAQWALGLDPDNGDAYLVRAFLAPPTSQVREQNLALAIRSFRRRYNSGDEAGLANLTGGLLIASKHHVMRGVMAAAAGQATVATTMMEVAQREAFDAERLDPDLVEAKTTRLIASTYLDRVANGSSATPDQVMVEIAELRARYPAEALVRMAHAQILALDLRWTDAKAAIDEAIALQPGNPLFLWTRAVIAAGSGACDAAATDFAEARKLAGSRSHELGFDQTPPCAGSGQGA